MNDATCAACIALAAAWTDLPPREMLHAIMIHMRAIRMMIGDDAFVCLVMAATTDETAEEGEEGAMVQ